MDSDKKNIDWTVVSLITAGLTLVITFSPLPTLAILMFLKLFSPSYYLSIISDIYRPHNFGFTVSFIFSLILSFVLVLITQKTSNKLFRKIIICIVLIIAIILFFLGMHSAFIGA